MKLTLKRTKKSNHTSGELFVNDTFQCYILEDIDRELTDQMTLEEIKSKKIYGDTAIPKGTYTIDMNTVSPKFKDKSWAKPYGGKVPRLNNVKGFEGVLIHPGNYTKDTYGCLLPAKSINNGIGSSSTEEFNKLMVKLLEAKAKGESITLQIV